MTPTLLAAPAAALMATAALAAPPQPGRLNDTGISLCMTRSGGMKGDCAGSGQDAEFGRDVQRADPADGRLGFSFVKLSADGRRLPADAPDWACVADRVTGLVWEMKTDDGGPHDKDQPYTNFGDGRAGDASALAAASRDAALCGRTDWRLPTRQELLGIVDYSTTYPGPTVDAAWFPHSEAYSVWTSTPQVGNSFSKWYVNFQEGNNAALNSDYAFGRARLVSGQPELPARRYRPVAAGAQVADAHTGLVWQRCSLGQTWDGSHCAGTAARMSWVQALAQAAAMAQDTGVAWRLPNVKELASLTEDSVRGPAVDSRAFPDTPQASLYWSGSPYASFPLYAWTVYSDNGSVTFQSTLGRGAVRLVRTAAAR